jgi:hypothetical protein
MVDLSAEFFNGLSDTNKEACSTIINNISSLELETRIKVIMSAVNRRIIQALDEDGFIITATTDGTKYPFRALKARYSIEAQIDLQKLHNIDLEEEMLELLAYQVYSEIKAHLLASDTRTLEAYTLILPTEESNFKFRTSYGIV